MKLKFICVNSWLQSLWILFLVSIFTSGSVHAGRFASRLASIKQPVHTARSGYKRATPDRLKRSPTKPRKPPVVNANEAMKLVRSGHRVLLPTEAGASQVLVDALVQRASALKGKRPVEVLHTASFLKRASHAEADPGRLRVHALFINGNLRKHVDKLRITPTYLSEIPKLLDNKLRPDVVLLKVSPPDKQGYVNTGVSAGIISDVLADPKMKVIAEINPHMPRTRGVTRLHMSHIDRMVSGSEQMAELNWGPTSKVDEAIGRLVAEQIPNRSTLQLGIGPIQKAVAEQVAKRGQALNSAGKQYRLRVRSEMIDDGLVAMAKAGVLSSSRNSVQLGFAVGSKSLYDFLDRDKRVQMLPTRQINDPMLAGKRGKLMAINSAIAIDLYGQACAEMVPRKGPDGKVRPVPYSGVGGQVDFFRAVQRSKGGKGFLTMRSTAKNGTLSTITLDLPRGLVVTTNRYDMDRVVTEWGTAELRGKDVVQRAQALVRIAHPTFRKQLATQGMDRFGGDPAAWQQAARVSPSERQRASAFFADQVN